MSETEDYSGIIVTFALLILMAVISWYFLTGHGFPTYP